MRQSTRVELEQLRDDIGRELVYAERHGWARVEYAGTTVPSTVWTSLTSLRRIVVDTLEAEYALAGLGTYADGVRFGLEDAQATIAAELVARFAEWREPLQDERADARLAAVDW